MAANDHLSPQQFFHGTSQEFQPGDLVDPKREIGVRRGQKSYAFMTANSDAAKNYGQYKADADRMRDLDRTGHAYEVEPTGPYEPDDSVDEKFQAYRSRHPLRVVREI